MPLINTSVPNLIQGVSQQPEATRFAGQCEEQENALSSVADGLKKRPNTRHVGRLMQEAINSNSFVHFIDRSEDEKYVIIQTTAAQDENILTAFNVKTGNQCTINGNASHTLATSDYLRSSNPSVTTQALTIADTTFLNNNTVIPQLTSTRSVASQKEAIVVVTQGDYDTDYVVKLSSNPILTGSASPSSSAATFNNPALTQITPASNPPRYELAGGQFGSNPTASPLTDEGSGYNNNNKQITVTSNGAIDQDAAIDAVLGSGGDADKIVQLDLIGAGVFQSYLSGTTSFALNISWSAYISPNLVNVNGNTTDQSVVSYTMTLDANSLTSYINAGSPSVDVVMTGIGNVGGVFAPAAYKGGILEYNFALSAFRAFDTFQGVSFNSSGVYQNTKVYNALTFGNAWRPYTRNNVLLSNWANHSGVSTQTINTYVEPTVTITAGTPASGNLVGTIEADYKSASPTIENPVGTYVPNLTARENINTNQIAASINGAFTGSSAALFHRYQDQNLLVVRPVSPTTQNFYVSVSDGLAGTGLQLLYKEVASISELPIYCKDGFKIKVQGDSSFDEDDFYVEFATNDNASYGTGVWNESIGFDVKKRLDANTMPQGLISVGVDEFVFGEFGGGTETTPTYGTYTFPRWADRDVGDDLSNPFSSFVETNPISAMTLFKNRLCLVSGSNVSFSEAGEFFNFSRKTVRSLLDSARIDVSVSSPQITEVTACVPFQGSLILFSNGMQLKLAGGDILSPRTVSIAPITTFAYESKTNPIVLGSYIYYPFDRGVFSGVNEFRVDATTDTFDSTEITEHVPAYLPSNIAHMSGTTSEDIMALVSNNDPKSIYIYNYFWNNNQKVLSAWSKFTFHCEVKALHFIGSTLYLIITDDGSGYGGSGETNLVELPLESGLTDAAGFNTHLDMRVATTVTHGSNSITLPYATETNHLEVYKTDGTKLSSTNSGNTVTLTQAVNDVDANGNDIDTPVFVGLPYTMKYTFSEQLFKAKTGNGTSPSNAAKLMIRNGSIYFNDTSSFKVKVTPKFRATNENIFTPAADSSSMVGTVQLDSGFYRFPVFTKAEDTTITIENDTALPSNFQSAEFESFVHSRSDRYG